MKTGTAKPVVLVPPEVPVKLRRQVADVVDVVPAGGGPPPRGKARKAEFVVAPFAGGEELRQLLTELPHLRGVQTLSAGVDWLGDAVPIGVPLYNCSGGHNVSVAEWVMAGILAILRDVPGYAVKKAERRWLPEVAGEIAQSRVTILGHGTIGREVARRLKPFGPASITGVGRRPRKGVRGVDDLPGILRQTDILINLLPLTEATRNLLGSRQLRLLPNGGLIVNAGRGGTVDQDALVAELRAGRLRAALDVTAPEPLGPDHPLWDCPNVFLSQHSAGFVALATERAWAVAADQIRRFATGRPMRNRVVDGY